VGYLYVLAAATLWGLLGSVSKLVFAQGVSPLEAAFWRAVMGMVVFGAHAIIARQTRINRKDFPAFVGFGLVGIALFYGGYQSAIAAGGAALAAVLLYTAPAMVALMSWLMLKEPMDGFKVLAIALTLLGVAAISLQGGSVRVTGAAVFWGLVSAFTYATYYIFGKLYLSRYTAPTMLLYALPVGALALAPFVHFVPKNLTAWATMVFLALASTYAANLFYYAGLKRLETTRASVVATLEPVVAALVAWLWWGEKFSGLGYLGALLVLSGVLLMVFKPSSGAQPLEAPQ
jgi:DME family drug/metabolite transporter